MPILQHNINADFIEKYVIYYMTIDIILFIQLSLN